MLPRGSSGSCLREPVVVDVKVQEMLASNIEITLNERYLT